MKNRKTKELIFNDTSLHFIPLSPPVNIVEIIDGSENRNKITVTIFDNGSCIGINNTNGIMIWTRTRQQMINILNSITI